MSRTDQQLLSARVSAPDHVVRRAFAEETIALNLRSGRYHGLNPMAAEMLERLLAGEPAHELATSIAARAREPVERVRADLLTLLRTLEERGLVAVDDAPPG